MFPRRKSQQVHDRGDMLRLTLCSSTSCRKGPDENLVQLISQAFVLDRVSPTYR